LGEEGDGAEAGDGGYRDGSAGHGPVFHLEGGCGD